MPEQSTPPAWLRPLFGKVLVVEGIPGVGKTTFGRCATKELRRHGAEARFDAERIDPDELSDFVTTMKRYELDPRSMELADVQDRVAKFQTRVMMARNDVIDDATEWVDADRKRRVAIIDRGVVGDLVFMMVSVERFAIPAPVVARYMTELLSRANRRCGPEMYRTVYLHTDAETAFARYLNRPGADNTEESSYEVSYFKKLERYHDKCIESGGEACHRIDGTSLRLDDDGETLRERDVGRALTRLCEALDRPKLSC